MSVHITNTIKAGLFSLDEGLINTETLESDGNLSDKNVIRETKANSCEHFTKHNINDLAISSNEYNSCNIISSRNEKDNRCVSGDNENSIILEDQEKNAIKEDHDCAIIQKYNYTNIIPENHDNGTAQVDDENSNSKQAYQDSTRHNENSNSKQAYQDNTRHNENSNSKQAYQANTRHNENSNSKQAYQDNTRHNENSNSKQAYQDNTRHNENSNSKQAYQDNTRHNDYDKNSFPEHNTITPTSEDHVYIDILEDHAIKITSEDHDRNIVTEGQASSNTYNITSEDNDRNIVPECQASFKIYSSTDDKDFSFPFMKLFSCTRNKRKTKDKYKYQKIISDKANKPFIDPFRQTQRSVLSTKYEHGAVPNHPYIYIQSNSNVDNSIVTSALTDTTLTQSEKVNSVNVNAKILHVEEVLRQQHLEHCKDVAHGTHIDADQYDFSHPHRGYAIIIVNKYFVRLYPRSGAEVDVEKARKILRKLGYFNKNTERLNLDKEKTLAILHDARNADHSNMDSFALIISSHGNEIETAKNGKKEHAIYCSDDQYIFTGDILEMFNDENCPSLKGKPKLFFIQACRGTNVDCGAEIGIFVDDAQQLNRAGHVGRVQSHHDGKHIDEEAIEDIMNSKSESKLILACDKSLDETDARGFLDSSEDKPIVHCNSDCLVMYGIPSGYYAWRSNDDGSWMLHYLWEEVMKYDYQKPCSLLKMLTAVNRKMADRETNIPDNPEKTGKKAIPAIVHRLDKDIVFKQKQIK